MLLKAKSGRWPFPYDAKSPSGHLRVCHRKAAAAQRLSGSNGVYDAFERMKYGMSLECAERPSLSYVKASASGKQMKASYDKKRVASIAQ